MSYIGSHPPATSVHRRRAGLALTGVFFVGLVMTLTALGTAASLAGRVLMNWDGPFALGAAVLTFVAGLATLGGPWLRRRVPDPVVRQRTGMAGAFAYGAAYSVATITTSAGPLILLLTVAAAMGRPAYGALLSLSYAIGRGMPFVFIGLFAGALGAWLERVTRARRVAEVVSGVVLVALSAYFVWLADVLSRG